MKPPSNAVLLVCAAAAFGGQFGCQVYVDEAPPPRRPVVYAARPAPPPPAVVYAPPPPRPRRPRPTTPSTATTVAALTPEPAESAAFVDTAPACLDTGPAPAADCSAMKAPDRSCAPFPEAAQRCTTYKANFDPKVAAAAVECMAQLSSKDVCNLAAARACARDALTRACPDSAVGQLCQIAAGPCKTSVADCKGLLSGLNEGGQEGVAQCVAKGCPGGLDACVDGLPTH